MASTDNKMASSDNTCGGTTNASIGKRGDFATVLHVDKNRIDIYVPHLHDTTWRIPSNLTHFASDHTSTI